MVGTSVKVGFTVVVAIILFVFVMSFMGFFKKEEIGTPYFIVFKQVAGLQIGAPVLKAGVKVGKVISVVVISHNEPSKYKDMVRLTIMLNSDKEVLTETSGFFISSNLMGDKWLEIIPRDGKILKPCDYRSATPWTEPCAVGIAPISIDEMMIAADQTLTRLDEAVRNFNDFLGDDKVQEDMKLAISNVKDAASSLSHLASNMDRQFNVVVDKSVKVIDGANKVVQNVNAVVVSAGGNISDITSSVKTLVDSNGASISDIVKNLDETSKNLNLAMKAIQEVVADERFGSSILGTLENLEKTTVELEGVVKDVRTITSDPNVQENLKATLQETRETVTGANKLIKRVRKFLGDKDNGESGSRSRIMQLDADMLWDTPEGFSHGNANLYLFPRGEHMLKLGVEEIGKDNKVNFQYGKNIGSFRPRIGVVRSQLGIGTDAFIGKNIELSVDAYNTSDVQVDLLGKYIINDSVYFMGGVRDAFDTKQGVLGVGKRF